MRSRNIMHEFGSAIEYTAKQLHDGNGRQCDRHIGARASRDRAGAPPALTTGSSSRDDRPAADGGSGSSPAHAGGSWRRLSTEPPATNRDAAALDEIMQLDPRNMAASRSRALGQTGWSTRRNREEGMVLLDRDERMGIANSQFAPFSRIAPTSFGDLVPGGL